MKNKYFLSRLSIMAVLLLGYSYSYALPSLTPEEKVLADACSKPIIDKASAQWTSGELGDGDAAQGKFMSIVSKARDDCAIKVHAEQESISNPASSLPQEETDSTSFPASSTPKSNEDILSSIITHNESSKCGDIKGKLKVVKTDNKGNASLVGLVDIDGEDSLSIPEGYYAVAQFGLQSQVLHEGSSIKLSCPPGKYKRPWSEVFRGLVSFFIPKEEDEAIDQNGQPVKFQASSHTIVAAIKGTQFAISASPSGDKLYVFEGSVETRSATHPNAPTVLVVAGQTVSGSETGLSAPREAKVSEITALSGGVIKTSGKAEDSIGTIRLDDIANIDEPSSKIWYLTALILLATVIGYLYIKR